MNKEESFQESRVEVKKKSSESGKHGRHSYDERTEMTANPPAKRLKDAAQETQGSLETPHLASGSQDAMVGGYVQHIAGSESVASDLSSGSTGSVAPREPDSPRAYASHVPPAPPSTPASNTDTTPWEAGSATPLPIRQEVENASRLEQQMLAEGAATPAPKAPPKRPSTDTKQLPEDFSDWAVGDRYELKRILGRGSYGQVAQAVDLFADQADSYVAIKRIQSPFDEEVDAVRLYREMYILRKMREHECIIKLLDVVQPPTDDLDDFHDLYLVF